MIFKRITSLLLLCAVCLTGFTACHGTNVSDPDYVPTVAIEEKADSSLELEFDPNKEYEITFWAKNDTNITQANIYKKAAADFEKLYPNIHVNYRLYTDYGRIYNDVLTNIQTETTPNVCITYPDHVATYLTGKDIVVPLNGYMNHPEYGLGGSKLKFDSPTFDEMIPKFMGECLFDDTYYALPYMRSTEALYVNKTYVEALGYTLPEVITWDFIWEVSEAALAKNDDGTFVLNGTNTMIPFIYKSTDNMMIQMLAQKNAGYSRANGDILLFNNTTKDLLKNIAFHAENRAFSTFKISSYPANFLNRGECVFAVDSTAGATWMGCDAPLIDIDEDNIVEFETEVFMIPQFDPDEPKMISQGPSVCIFNKEDKGEVLASWLFTQYLLTNEVQIAYAETEGYIPVTSKAHETAEYKDYLSRGGTDNDMHYFVKLDATKLLLDNIDNTFTTPVFNGSASLRDASGQLIETVVKAVRRGSNASSLSYDDIFDEVISLYDLDRSRIFRGANADIIGSPGENGLNELGKLPLESTLLLAGLGVIWCILGIYFAMAKFKKSKK